ncbi:hypothetical protein HNP86_001569 [Methanococcus maripaludis]|uniref:Uncharacterized protein n=1 Tax=Methanococcus maripaludis TaxID=39152 RepID=A0A7J9P078_METMI|nr:BsuBI/PstI family type II restriction endonuclease [Methanococcus maripaludis]MBA2851416.1 hypothetical protein [Methanococcus maripaludis]
MGKLGEALAILKKFELPVKQQNNRSAYTLLALANIQENSDWKDSEDNLVRIHDILLFISENYGYTYAENSRETIRRQTIHQFEHAGIVERNKDDPKRPTNSGKTVYSLTSEFLEVLKTYGTDDFEKSVEWFLDNQTSLSEKYQGIREIHKISVKVDDTELEFSSGEHNELQKDIIEEFAPRFAGGSKVLYVGDTAHKNLYKLDDELEKLGIPMTKHDKLPDVVLYDEKNNWIYLIEAVTSHGPVSDKRYYELEEMLEECKCGKIYVSCFKDKATFKKYVADIAWDTEVWISDIPNHMIHYNGDRFIGPR